MKSRKKSKIVFLVWIIIFTLQPTFAFCSIGSFLSKPVREAFEYIFKKSTTQGLKELAEIGGEKAVQEVLEQAVKEGGEQMAERVAFYTVKYGANALKAISRSPGRIIKALDEIPESMVRPALGAIEREGDSLVKLVNAYGKESLELAAKHPGVGSKIVEKLGDDGIRIAKNLTNDQAIVLARASDTIAKLPKRDQVKVYEILLKSAGEALDYLEKHPKILATSAGLSAFYMAHDNLFGESNNRTIYPNGRVEETASGMIDRIFGIEIIKSNLNMILIITGIGIFCWIFIRLFWLWKIQKLKYENEEYKLNNNKNKNIME